MPDMELVAFFIATWAMILPLYYYIGEIKSQVKSCPACKKSIAEKEIREAVGEGA